MRKKITNKEKFQFREEEILSPPPLTGRNSFQSRLAKKAGNKITLGGFAPPSSGSSNDSRQGTVRLDDYRHGPIQVGGLSNQKSGSATIMANSQQPRSQDPVLAEIVAKLKSGLQLDLNSQRPGEPVHPRGAMAAAQYQAASNLPRLPPKQASLAPEMQEKPSLAVKDCVCFRPLKLVMCEVCGETFRGRVSLACHLHPRALYLQDVKECKGCKQGNKEALKEFDLPPGMEIRKLGEMNKRGEGMN